MSVEAARTARYVASEVTSGRLGLVQGTHLEHVVEELGLVGAVAGACQHVLEFGTHVHGRLFERQRAERIGEGQHVLAEGARQDRPCDLSGIEAREEIADEVSYGPRLHGQAEQGVLPRRRLRLERGAERSHQSRGALITRRADQVDQTGLEAHGITGRSGGVPRREAFGILGKAEQEVLGGRIRVQRLLDDREPDLCDPEIADPAGSGECGDAALVAHLFNGPSYHGEEGEQLVAGYVGGHLDLGDAVRAQVVGEVPRTGNLRAERDAVDREAFTRERDAEGVGAGREVLAQGGLHGLHRLKRDGAGGRVEAQRASCGRKRAQHSFEAPHGGSIRHCVRPPCSTLSA